MYLNCWFLFQDPVASAASPHPAILRKMKRKKGRKARWGGSVHLGWNPGSCSSPVRHVSGTANIILKPKAGKHILDLKEYKDTLFFTQHRIQCQVVCEGTDPVLNPSLDVWKGCLFNIRKSKSITVHLNKRHVRYIVYILDCIQKPTEKDFLKWSKNMCQHVLTLRMPTL